jgi:hypothetical protein
MTITKDQARAALMTLRAGRSPMNGNRAIRAILAQFGATNINELDPALYESVIAAVTIPTLSDFYGVVLDVPVPVTSALDGQKRLEPPRASGSHQSVITTTLPGRSTNERVKSPLTLDLEARLKERAGKPRQVPHGRVDIGAPSQFGDQDDSAVRNVPGTRML